MICSPVQQITIDSVSDEYIQWRIYAISERYS